MRVPLYSAASTTSTPADMPLMMRLRMGKFCGAGGCRPGIGDQCAAEDHNLFGEPRVFFRIHDVDSGAETATVLPLAATAPRCDEVSMPRANPLIITDREPQGR